MWFRLIAQIATAFCAAGILVGNFSPASGQASGEFAVFNQHEPDSPTRLALPDWHIFLKGVVLDVGPSHRFRANTSSEQITGSRLGNRVSKSASWLEGNRLRYHLFDSSTERFLDAQIANMITAAQQDGKEITGWSRDEQLAYWLNLHNMLVVRLTAEHYPFRSLKKLRSRNWSVDKVTILGVGLSIEDIQNEIVLAIWDDPNVIYGFFQGAVGGPSLRPLALRGETIHLSLQRNGEEFVNSYRGVHARTHARGKYARVSNFYEWVSKAFPDFENDLKRHLYTVADGRTAELLDQTRAVRLGYFNWTPPDFYGGNTSTVSSSVPMSAATAITGGDSAGATVHNLRINDMSIGARMAGRIPDHARLFMAAMRKKFRKYNMPQRGMTDRDLLAPSMPTGTVTVTEIERAEETPEDEENKK